MEEGEVKNTSKPLPSYCLVCDAADGECRHGGPRYVAEVVYQRTEENGWRVPDSEADDWRQRGQRLGVVEISQPKPKSLESLVQELDFWLYLGKATRERLEEAYARNPMRVTRLVERTIQGAQSGGLNMPDLYLDGRLKQELE